MQMHREALDNSVDKLTQMRSWAGFWKGMDKVLADLGAMLSADASLLLTGPKNSARFSVRSFWGLDKTLVGAKVLLRNSALKSSIMAPCECTIIALSDLKTPKIGALVTKHVGVHETKIHVLLLPFDLVDDNLVGLALFFFGKSDLDQEVKGLPVVCQVLSGVKIAYHHCQLRIDLQQEKARQQKTLDGLRQASAAITRTRNAKKALQTLATSIIGFMDLHSVAIIPLNEQGTGPDLDEVVAVGVERAVATPAENEDWLEFLDLLEASSDGLLVVQDLGEGIEPEAMPPSLSAAACRHEVRSCSIFLLHSNKKRSAVLLANARQPQYMTADRIGVLLKFVEQATLIFTLESEHRASRRHIRELQTLLDVGRKISAKAALSPREVLEEIWLQLSDIMQAENLFCALYDREKNVISFELAYEGGKPVQGEGEYETRTFAAGLTEWVIQAGQPVLIASNFQEWLEKHGVPLVGRPAKSWLAVPLVVEGEVIGVLAVQDFEREFQYDESDALVLETVGSFAASAIFICKLIAQLSDSKEQVEAMVKAQLQETKSTFIGDVFYDIVAHDLKNLILLIKANLAEIQDSRYINKLSNTGRRSLIGLFARVSASADTIKQFLELTRSDLKKSGSTDIENLYRRVVSLNTVPIEKMDVEVEVDVDPKVQTIRVNALDMVMVVFNLVSNALAALGRVKRGRCLSLSAKLSSDRQWVELEVEDNGAGMTRDLQARIFQPGSKGKESSGSGLGLFGTKRIVDLLGGSISVQSRYGKGTTMLVRLPINLAF